MMVREVMSTRLLCVTRERPLSEVAALLVRNRISGVPVVDEEGHVLGVISESDLQPLKEGIPDRPFRTAGDAMTAPVISLNEGDTVTEAARVLAHHGIKRAPVLRNGVIVGMIARGDLLRPYLRTDLEIRADVEEALFGDSLNLREGQIKVGVFRGVVQLEGWARDRRQGALAVRLARSVDGVVDVDDGLDFAVAPVGMDIGG